MISGYVASDPYSSCMTATQSLGNWAQALGLP